MKSKDYEPIKFEFFQSDMEQILFFLDKVKLINKDSNPDDFDFVQYLAGKIKDDLGNKIECHIEEGEWK